MLRSVFGIAMGRGKGGAGHLGINAHLLQLISSLEALPDLQTGVMEGGASMALLHMIRGG